MLAEPHILLAGAQSSEQHTIYFDRDQRLGTFSGRQPTELKKDLAGKPKFNVRLVIAIYVELSRDRR